VGLRLARCLPPWRSSNTPCDLPRTSPARVPFLMSSADFMPCRFAQLDAFLTVAFHLSNSPISPHGFSDFIVRAVSFRPRFPRVGFLTARPSHLVTPLAGKPLAPSRIPSDLSPPQHAYQKQSTCTPQAAPPPPPPGHGSQLSLILGRRRYLLCMSPP